MPRLGGNKMKQNCNVPLVEYLSQPRATYDNCNNGVKLRNIRRVD